MQEKDDEESVRGAQVQGDDMEGVHGAKVQEMDELHDKVRQLDDL